MHDEQERRKIKDHWRETAELLGISVEPAEEPQPQDRPAGKGHPQPSGPPAEGADEDAFRGAETYREPEPPADEDQFEAGLPAEPLDEGDIESRRREDSLEGESRRGRRRGKRGRRQGSRREPREPRDDTSVRQATRAFPEPEVKSEAGAPEPEPAPIDAGEPAADEAGEEDRRRRRRGGRSRRRGRPDRKRSAGAFAESDERQFEGELSEDRPEEEFDEGFAGRPAGEEAVAEVPAGEGDDEDYDIMDEDQGDFSDWNVPSWNELIASLYRPER